MFIHVIVLLRLYFGMFFESLLIFARNTYLFPLFLHLGLKLHLHMADRKDNSQCFLFVLSPSRFPETRWGTLLCAMLNLA